MKSNTAGKAYLYAILAVLFWATCPTAFKLGLRGMDTWQLMTGATLVSTLVLGGISLFQGKMPFLIKLSRKDVLFSALMGLLNPVAYYLILFKAYSILPAQVAQPLNMVWPILLVLLSIPLLGHKITWKSMGAMFLSFSGVILVSMQRGALDLHPDNRLGVFLALASSVLWAFYFILNSRGKTDPVLRLFLNFAFASVYILVLSLFRENSFPFTSRDWLAAAYVGIFEMGITFVLWIMAIRMASSSDKISNLVYIAPFLNLLLAHFVLGETILLSTIYGIALLVSGIVIQSMLQKNAKRI